MSRTPSSDARDTTLPGTPDDDSEPDHTDTDRDTSAFPLLGSLSPNEWRELPQPERGSLGDEITDSCAGFPSNSSEVSSESDEHYGPRESLLVADAPCQWLMLIDSCRGTYELDFRDPSGDSLMRAYVLDGRICAGMSRDGTPYVDATLRAEDPDFAEAYLQYCHRRSTAGAEEPASAVVDIDVLEPNPHQRHLFARQIIDLFRRGAGQVITRRRVSCDGVHVTSPLTFSPVELALTAPMAPPDPVLARFRRDFEQQSSIPAISRWTFELQEGQGASCRLVDTDAPGMRTLADMSSAISRLERLAKASRTISHAHAEDISHAMGFEGEHVWIFVQHGDQALVQSHQREHAGPAHYLTTRLLSQADV
ncbi:MAG: hypothetical protein ACQEVA_20130 [Myxococcota bacterium]